MSEMFSRRASSSRSVLAWVEHDQEFTVGEHGPGRVGLEQIVHILGQAGTAGTVLPHPLPKGEQEVGAVLMLEQQIDLIDIDPGIPPQAAVAGDSVEKAVQDHQHAHGEQLFAQLPDVITGDAGAHVHIGGFGKGVETALREQFQGQSHIPRLGLRLAQQFGVKVPGVWGPGPGSRPAHSRGSTVLYSGR